MFCSKTNAFVSALCWAALSGCSPNYLPIGDYKVFMDFYLPNAGGEQGIAQSLLCRPDEQFCGRRKVDEDEHEQDQFFNLTEEDIALGTGDWALGWSAAFAKNASMEAGVFELITVNAKAGEVVRFSFNDSGHAATVIPPLFQVMEPEFFAPIGRTSSNTLRVTWEPSNQGFPMYWKFFPLDNEPKTTPCDMLDWSMLQGLSDDTGELNIPLDGVPMEMPPEGCGAAVILRRRSMGVLPPDLPSGHVRSSVVGGVVFWFVP